MLNDNDRAQTERDLAAMNSAIESGDVDAAIAALARTAPSEWSEHDFYVEAVCHSAGFAIAADRPEVALALVDIAGMLPSQRDALAAVVARDFERAFAELAAARLGVLNTQLLDRCVGEHIANELAHGDWAQRVLSVEARQLGAVPDDGELAPEARAWAEQIGLPGVATDGLTRSVAVLRLALGRCGGPDPEVFARLAAHYGWHVPSYAPALFAEAAQHARELVDARSLDPRVLRTWAVDELLRGRERELRERIAAISQARPSAARRLAMQLPHWLDAARTTEQTRAGLAFGHVVVDVPVVPNVLGEFTVDSGALVLMDPCYARAETYRDHPLVAITSAIPHAKCGRWRAAVVPAGDDPVLILAHHVDHACDVTASRWHPTDSSLGVDSGTIGIFDASHCGEGKLAIAAPAVLSHAYIAETGKDGTFHALWSHSDDGAVAVAILCPPASLADVEPFDPP